MRLLLSALLSIVSATGGWALAQTAQDAPRASEPVIVVAGGGGTLFEPEIAEIPTTTQPPPPTTEPPPPVAPEVPAQPSGARSWEWWEAIAQCESGNQNGWRTGYYGIEAGYPIGHLTKEEQYAWVQRIYADYGDRAWGCSGFAWQHVPGG